jgi:hypothetical protein
MEFLIVMDLRLKFNTSEIPITSNKLQFTIIYKFQDFLAILLNTFPQSICINGPSNIYDDKQLKLLVNYENNVKNATSLKTQFENWFLAMPVLSFNGSKYDINLINCFLSALIRNLALHTS